MLQTEGGDMAHVVAHLMQLHLAVALGEEHEAGSAFCFPGHLRHDAYQAAGISLMVIAFATQVEPYLPHIVTIAVAQPVYHRPELRTLLLEALQLHSSSEGHQQAADAFLQDEGEFVGVAVESRVALDAYHLMARTIVDQHDAVGMVLVLHVLLVDGGMLALVGFHGHQYHATLVAQHIALVLVPAGGSTAAIAAGYQHRQLQAVVGLEETAQTVFGCR